MKTLVLVTANETNFSRWKKNKKKKGKHEELREEKKKNR